MSKQIRREFTNSSALSSIASAASSSWGCGLRINNDAVNRRPIGVLKYTIAVCFFLISCVEKSAVNHPDDILAIEEMSAARADAFNRGDAVGIAAHFTKDGVIMPPGMSTAVGRDAVEAYYQQIFDQYETVLDSHYEEVWVSGDLAFGRGIAEVTLISLTDDDVVTSVSKYINILQRQEDGTWLTTHDIWNENH